MLKRLTPSNDDGGCPQTDLSSDAMYFRYHLVEFITEHLIDVSRTFEGDLREALVLAIIEQVLVGVMNKHGVGAAKDSRSIAASRIADITRIPRQTVRRKLASLKKRGWIEQDELKGWRLILSDNGRAVALRDLTEIDARGIQRGIRLVRAYKERL